MICNGIFSDSSSLPEAPPLWLGATGGSGTRILGTVLRTAGVYIGSERNRSEDALALVDGIERLALEGERLLDSDGQPAASDVALWREVLVKHLEDHAGEAFWGWKNPRSMFLLPLTLALFPGTVFIHMVRDGRDMVLSANQRQYLRHCHEGDGSLADRARFWSRTNLAVRRFAEKRMGERYILLRYEDLCNDPTTCMSDLAGRLGLPSLAGALPLKVASSGGAGRYLTLPQAERVAVEDAARPGLEEFGYV